MREVDAEYAGMCAHVITGRHVEVWVERPTAENPWGITLWLSEADADGWERVHG